MKKILFIDRDGTLIKEPEDEQVDSLDKLDFLPGVLTWLSRLCKDNDYELVMVTNQDGLGTEAYPEEIFWPIQNFIMRTLESEGIIFSEVVIDKKKNSDGRGFYICGKDCWNTGVERKKKIKMRMKKQMIKFQKKKRKQRNLIS